jgi:hypothetical protein
MQFVQTTDFRVITWEYVGVSVYAVKSTVLEENKLKAGRTAFHFVLGTGSFRSLHFPGRKDSQTRRLNRSTVNFVKRRCTSIVY